MNSCSVFYICFHIVYWFVFKVGLNEAKYTTIPCLQLNREHMSNLSQRSDIRETNTFPIFEIQQWVLPKK